MLNEAPDSTCMLSAAGSEVAVAVCEQRTVWYEFDTSATDPKLALPYAVAVDGKVLPEFAQKAHALSKTNRTITLKVKRGATVALYLNSDAHPSYRNYPVYQIRVGERDALVKITEQKGRLSHLSAEAGFPYEGERNGRPIDSYRATLTGDIWMRISHIYTVAEANALLPSDIDSVIRAAVNSIYGGLPKPEIQLNFPAGDSLPPACIRVRFEEQDSVRMNTTLCPLLTQILPRTHPCGFAALFTAARVSHIKLLRVASCWRTSLGSIVHRAGLGLDVVYIESDAEHIPLNRASLRKRSAPVTPTVSSEEREAFKAYEDSKAEATLRDNELVRAKSKLAKASDSTHRQQCETEFELAKTRKQTADKNSLDREEEWRRIREAHIPATVRNFRKSLAHNSRVCQLLDPWYLDLNTRDKLPPSANELRSALETLHQNHVHITITEPGLS